jgi:hypothetical protein
MVQWACSVHLGFQLNLVVFRGGALRLYSEIFRISSIGNTFKTFISRVLVFCCYFFLICSSLPNLLLSLPFFWAFAVLRSVPSNRYFLLSVRLHHPNSPWRDLNKIWYCGILQDTSGHFSFDYNKNIKYNVYSTCQTYIHSSNFRRLTRHHNEWQGTSHHRMRRTKGTLGCVWIVLKRDFLYPLHV